MGATGGALLFLHAPRFAPVVVLTDVALVIVASVALARDGGVLSHAPPPPPGGDE